MLKRPVQSFLQLVLVSFALILLGNNARANPLVSAEWLSERLKSPGVVVLDASPTPLYNAGHIRGAHSVDVFSFGPRDLTPADMTTNARRWGVNADTLVVLMDQGGTYMAVSLFHDLTRVGMPVANLRVLDGGLAKWRASGFEVTKDAAPVATPGTIAFRESNARLRTSLADVLAASGAPDRHMVIDALGADYYYGAAKFFNRGGHIPQAKLLAAEDVFNADKTFKSRAELTRMLAHMGAMPSQTIHTYCGGGMAAALPYFVARHIADYPDVRLYKGSQREWLRDPRVLPLWNYPVPGLLRDREWVAGWNHDMMRAFKVAEMNLVDIRSAERFAAGHIPHSISVPFSAIESAADASALATLFANAGVDPRDETIIVSDGGINPDSAKAFVALERAGYSRIALLTLSVDEWGLSGGKLATGNSAAPAKPAPRAAAIPVITKRAVTAATPAVLMTGSSPAAGQIAVDQLVPKLIAANGMPKSAYEIASALDKAGVSRFADVTAEADRVGNAAVSYVVLKLMGYPSVSYKY